MFWALLARSSGYQNLLISNCVGEQVVARGNDT